MRLIHELAHAVVQGVQDRREEEKLVPLTGTARRRNSHTIEWTYRAPRLFRKGEVVITQHSDLSRVIDWPANQEVFWNPPSHRIVIRRRKKPGLVDAISEVHVSGNHKVLVTCLEVERVKVEGGAEITLRNNSSPREVITERGKIKLLSPRE